MSGRKINIGAETNRKTRIHFNQIWSRIFDCYCKACID